MKETINIDMIRITEECGEVIQSAMKAARFGLDHRQPDITPVPVTNKQDFINECLDLYTVLTDMFNKERITLEEIEAHVLRKHEKQLKWKKFEIIT